MFLSQVLEFPLALSGADGSRAPWRFDSAFSVPYFAAWVEFTRARSRTAWGLASRSDGSFQPVRGIATTSRPPTG